MTKATVNTASAGTATNEDAQQQQQQQHHGYLPTRRQSAASMFGRMAGIAIAVAAAPVAVVHADEIGREVEMTLDVTGEALMICTKRGPLGACTKTVYRTAENDNDKAATYMGKPSDLVSQKDREARRSSSEDAGNALIEKLKQRSEDNSEKNARLVEQRTQLNDASANFGPFSKSVLIENQNGIGFTLLENPQAMRLKKLGLIGSKKKFLRQPTQKELDDALIVPETSLLGSIVKTVGGIVGVVGLGFGYTQIPDENRKQIETKAKQVTTKFSETFLEQK